MSSIELIMAAEAASQNRAVRRTAYRHRHVSSEPLVVAAYNLSGEAAAPLGFCFGTSPGQPGVAVAPEPRNRVARFGAIDAVSRTLVSYVAPFLTLVEQERGRGRTRYTLEVAEDAPQIVVPNRATREYLGARLGRSLRYLHLSDQYEVPEETSWAGAILTWLSEYARMPGQSIFVAATELLARHFVTGQSDLENENLASLLAWVENPAGAERSRIDAAESAAFGPVPDPEWEAKLEPLVRSWTEALRAEQSRRVASIGREVERRLRAELTPAYEATHRALALVREIPAARTVERRWRRDVEEWGRYVRQIRHGLPKTRRRHDPIRAAKLLEQWTSASDQLEYEEALDDPLVLAQHDAIGRCVGGEVTAVDLDNREVKPGNERRTQVPLVSVRLDGPTKLLRGERVVWTGQPGVKARVRSVSVREAVLAVVEGHSRGTRVPKSGDQAMFVALDVFGGRPPELPKRVPWTHRGAADPADPGDDGSPDLSPAELAARTVVGVVPHGDVPGVVL